MIRHLELLRMEQTAMLGRVVDRLELLTRLLTAILTPEQIEVIKAMLEDKISDEIESTQSGNEGVHSVERQ